MADKTVLVVEDNHLNRKLVRSLLQIGRYRVVEAADGIEGLEAARRERPDLILMDLQLPGMDGLSATRELRADPQTAGIPVVALTAHAMVGDEERALEAGCRGYIPKPIDTRAFLERIREYLQGRNDGAAAESFRSTILIVDDDPMNVKLLSAMLPADRHRVLRAFGGAEALEAAGREHPDLILMDVMMPGVDGLEATRRLRSNPETSRIPVLMITALEENGHKAEALAAGADDFLSKPVHRAELLSRVNSMLCLKRCRDQLAVREEAAQGMEPVPTDQAPPRGRVLVVAPEEAEILRYLGPLQDQACDLSRADRPEDAWDRVLRRRPDLVLAEMGEDPSEVLALCRRIKRSEETRTVQVVLVSLWKDLEHKLQGIEQGADDYLIHPVDSRELTVRVRTLLQKKAYLDYLRSHAARAADRAITDPQTGLYSRGFLERFLELEVKRALRYRYPVALVLIRPDGLDALGVGSGLRERLLAETGRAIRRAFRETDLAARYGPEVLAVVLHHLDPAFAATIVRRIRDAALGGIFLEDTERPLPGQTLSMGMVVLPRDTTRADELVRRAEDLLHRALEQGGDRCCTVDAGRAG